MNQTKIISFALLIVAGGLAYYLVDSIAGTIREKKRIASVEERVKDRLVVIREAQIAYQAVNGDYTSNWDELAKFIESGIFYITQRTETIITLDYGADSVVVDIDTLGTRPVRDSLFNENKFQAYNFRELKFIPETEGKTFDLFTAEIEKSGVKVDVIEVRDTAPADPARKESNEAKNRKPLRFGSRTDVTTAGNWE